MRAFIITIGDELLLGQILNTNSRAMAAALAGLGIETAKIMSVSDKKTEILKAFKEGFENADLVLVSGGLGPTKDDITKTAAAEFFGTKLVFREEVYQWVKDYFRGKELALNEYNRSQAYQPESCVSIRNAKGTACAMWFERAGKVMVLMPGVPFELEYLLSAEIMPRIKKTFKCGEIAYKMLGVYDKAESELALLLAPFEQNLPEGLALAYLPSPAYVKLRLTAKNGAVSLLEKYFAELKNALAGLRFNIIGAGGDIAELLEKLSRVGTIAAAESCTGGNISALITAKAGASSYYLGGVTAYSNEVKINVLGVRRETLEKYGAVSEETALEMAQGVRRITGARWGVATTGIAGPTGAVEGKPVGTVWIAVSGPKGCKAKRFCFSAVRERNIGKASAEALQMLLAFAQESEK